MYHFQLAGQNCWYHTKFRPGWRKFLEDMSKCFELHIFTMGSRMYAHTIARMLDPTGVLFAERIRSRDESFDMFSKYRDLRFVRGDQKMEACCRIEAFHIDSVCKSNC